MKATEVLEWFQEEEDNKKYNFRIDGVSTISVRILFSAKEYRGVSCPSMKLVNGSIREARIVRLSKVGDEVSLLVMVSERSYEDWVGKYLEFEQEEKETAGTVND